MKHPDETGKRPIKEIEKLKERTGDPSSGFQGQCRELPEHRELSFRLIQYSAIPTFVLDPGHRVIHWNKACEELTGTAASDVVGTSDHWKAFYKSRRPLLADFAIDGNTKELSAYYDAYGESTFVPGGLHSEGWYAELGGKDRYIIFDAAPIYDSNGALIAVVETLQDITDRKRAEEDLQLFRNLINHSNDAVYVIDSETGRFLDVNDTSCKNLGYSRPELLTMCVCDLEEAVPDCASWRKHAGQVKQQGSVIFEGTHRRKDGSVFPVETDVKFVSLEKKNYMIAIVRDVSKRKSAEENLEHRIRMEIIISKLSTYFINFRPEEIDDGINYALQIIGEFADVDRSYVFLFSGDGKRFDNTHEWSADGVEPYIRLLRDLAAEDFPWVMEKIKRFQPVHIPSVDDLPLAAAEEKRYFKMQDIKSLVIVPMAHGGSLTGFLGFDSVRTKKSWKEDDIRLLKLAGEIFANALERKASEEKIRKYAERLEEANRELEAFSYSVSHDLKAPLRRIDAFSQALREEFSRELDGQGKDYLQRIEASIRRMSQLVDALLNLSGMTRCEMKRETIDLSALAESISDDLTRAHPGRRIEFMIASGVNADGDKRLLRIALENLFGNAVKFTSKNPRALIEFGVTEREGSRVFFVKDNGAGFDQNYSDKLFSPFQRLHSADHFPGTGIGLATVQRIIRRHGGRVWAEGQVEKGAVFYFTL